MNWLSFFEHFHFLRPYWLLAIIPLVILALILWQQLKRADGDWRHAIDPHLLPYLLSGTQTRQSKLCWIALLIAWPLCCIALAGPSWKQLPQPVHQRDDALVIVLDLSLSMYAQDAKPSRLIAARRKVIDILRQREEGNAALIAYAGDAHIVSPLTDDYRTIINLLPGLEPSMMPAFGSNTIAAFEQAANLLNNAGHSKGRLLLISDEIADRDISDLAKIINKHGFSLAILGVGSKEGAPIPNADGGFLKDAADNIIVTALSSSRFKRLAQEVGGRYRELQLNESDIQFLLPKKLSDRWEGSTETTRQFDLWKDAGPYLVWLILPFALFAFRRGWLLSIGLLVSLHSPDSMALDWQSLWQRSDQRGAQAFQQGDHQRAAELFKDPAWAGSANYRAGNYEAAAEQFSQQQGATAAYNRGVAQAKAGKFDEAIKSFDEALKLDPDMEDAKHNRELIEKLQKQQQEQQKQDQQNQNQENDQQNQSDQNQNSQSGENNQQSGEPQDSSNQNKNNSQQQDSNKDQQQQSSPEKSETEDNEQAESSKTQQAQATETNENEEQQQAEALRQMDADEAAQQQKTDQWLRQIPDDPAGLLRRKFEYEYRHRNQQTPNGNQQPW